MRFKKIICLLGILLISLSASMIYAGRKIEVLRNNILSDAAVGGGKELPSAARKLAERLSSEFD